MLIDFGAARWEEGNQDRFIMEVFTPEYAAPEQVYSHGNVGPWTDICCLAATLYRAIQRKPPASPLQRALGADHVAASEAAAPGFSPRFLAGIDAALALKPEDRPQDVVTWRRMLDDAANTRPGKEAGAGTARATGAKSGRDRAAPARVPPARGNSQPPSAAGASLAPKRRRATTISDVSQRRSRPR